MNTLTQILKYLILIDVSLFFHLGFLLGKFVSDRHHHIREIALQQYRYPNQAQVKTALALPTSNFMSHPNSVSHTELNEKLWLEFMGCIQRQKFNYAQRLDDFVTSFIDEEYRVLTRCLLNSEQLIDNYTKR